MLAVEAGREMPPSPGCETGEASAAGGALGVSPAAPVETSGDACSDEAAPEAAAAAPPCSSVAVGAATDSAASPNAHSCSNGVITSVTRYAYIGATSIVGEFKQTGQKY